jgi:hypothetical protein
MLESSEKKLIIIVGRLEKFKIQDMTPSLLTSRKVRAAINFSSS